MARRGRARTLLGGVIVERGAVHLTQLPGIGRRPALVVSWAGVNMRLGQPVMARITTVGRERALDTFVALQAGEGGLEHESFVLCHDLTTVGASAVGLRLGRLHRRRMRQVDVALRRSLGL